MCAILGARALAGPSERRAARLGPSQPARLLASVGRFGQIVALAAVPVWIGALSSEGRRKPLALELLAKEEDLRSVRPSEASEFPPLKRVRLAGWRASERASERCVRATGDSGLLRSKGCKLELEY